MSTQFEKRAPIVAGCKALVIKGHNLGKTVHVDRFLDQIGETYERDGKQYVIGKDSANKWLVEGQGLILEKNDDTGDLVVRDRGCFHESYLMRLDGGKEAFTAEDCFVYGAKSV